MPVSACARQPGQTKSRLAGLALAALLGLAGCGAGAPQGYTDVTAGDLHARMQPGASPTPYTLVDVRTPQEFSAGHIRGALLIPVSTLEKHLDAIPRSRPVYVYCQAGARSARAATLLARHGYTQINNVQGGIAAWQRAGYEVVK